MYDTWLSFRRNHRSRMKHFFRLIIWAAFCVLLNHCQQIARFLPTLYVTSVPERAVASQVVVYGATICNGGLYNEMMVAVRVNLPQGWDTMTGYVAKIEACKSMECDALFCTNWPNHHFSGYHYCNFTYNSESMSSIYVRVTAGPSPNIDWTIGVEFFRKEDWVSPPPVVSASGLKCAEPKGRVGSPLVKVLMQIVRTALEQRVQTLQRNAYILRFCPDSQTTDKYTITISVTATDGKSAFATYVCLPSQLPCGVLSSTHFDGSGIAVNTVHISTVNADMSELHLIIVGWGDANHTNTFTLGATLLKNN